MKDVRELEPQAVFRYFQEISDVPRSSYHNEQISAYLVDFAEKHGLRYYQDEALNVILYKEATPGYEAAEPVMLQGHMDMVAARTADSTHDFSKDPLDIYVDGDYVTADRTTLGADNGIAVAMALAVLAAEDIPHPALEVVITTDEEVDMLGASALDPARMHARRILNIDSEEEGFLTVGCAGGENLTLTFPARRETVQGLRYRYTLSGLRGGHSGMEIHLERANGAVLTGRILLEASRQADVRILSLAGGSASNVILNQVTGDLCVAAEDRAAFEASIAASTATCQNEYRTADPGLEITLECIGETEAEAVRADDQRRILQCLEVMPCGVYARSVELEGLVETSDSIGVLELGEDSCRICVMLRSLVNSRSEDLANKIRILTEALGGQCTSSGSYGAWEFNKDSDFLRLCERVYEEQYGEKPRVGAVHAGLECGKWAEKLGAIEAVSIGPDMYDVHSVNERLSISSTARTWTYLKGILSACH